jgi:hypothetical protein
VGVTVQEFVSFPAQASPVQRYAVADGLQLAVKVDEPPAEIEAGFAVRVQAGVAGTEATSAVWQDNQSLPCAVSQAASMVGSPLETRPLLHRYVLPESRELGGAGTEPVNWLFPTQKYCKAVRPLSEGIGPVSWLLVTQKCCKAVRPMSEGIEPVNLLIVT